MKRVIKIAGWLVLSVILIFSGGAAYFQFKGIPSFEAQTVNLQVEGTPQQIANGKRIAALLCMQCHAGSDGKLTGKRILDLPAEFGEVYSMNITQHPENGIGKWTDGQLIYFLRTGIRPNGSYAPPYMPKYPTAADEDLEDIIAWLRSNSAEVQPSPEEAPPSKPSLMTKILVNTVMGPMPYPEKRIAKPDTTDQLALGSYLANSLMGCFACHSRDFKTNNDLNPVQSEGYMGGGNPLLDFDGNVVVSSNITFDKTGIAGWTKEQFIEAVRHAKRPDGSLLRYPMVPQITLTDYEVGSIFEYLRTVPPIDNPIAGAL